MPLIKYTICFGHQQVGGYAIDEQDKIVSEPQPRPKLSKTLPEMPKFPVAMTPVVVPENSMENLILGQVNQLNNSPKPIRPIPILPVPPSSKMANLNLNKAEPPSLSLNLSISSEAPAPSSQTAARHASAFQGMPSGFNGSGGDSMISVA